MEQARDSRLNHVDEKLGGVPPQWNDYIKPFLHGSETKEKLWLLIP